MRTFNAYQEFTNRLACYNNDVFVEVDNALVDIGFMYPVAALAEEAGEVNGKVAKFIRKSKTMNTAEVSVAYEQLQQDVLKELGDVAYQLSECAWQFGFTLQEVIDANVSKLTDRQERGVLVGEGDNR